ncbi:MAG: hypothetical protein AAGM40_12690 [Cyanobacteria bacterium J06573_2]
MVKIEEKLKRLEKALAENPTDTNLMNELALEYFFNPKSLQDNEDIKLLEKAYQTNKTVKSTHNLAWFYYEGYGENSSIERAMEIQQECISMNPKSYYPYHLYGVLLLINDQNSEAIKYLEIAYLKEKCRDIANDLGVAYAKSGNFEIAKDYLMAAAKVNDIEYKSKYNLAITKIQLNEKEDALTIAEEFKKLIIDGVDNFDTIDGFSVAYLYYLLDDQDTAYACCKTCDGHNYDLLSWEFIPYLIYKNDIQLFQKLIVSKIEKKKTWIKENKDNHEYWKDDTEEEKQQELAEYESEITRLRNLEAEFALGKPNIDINDSYFLEYCGCLLFGCPEHNNLEDDE